MAAQFLASHGIDLQAEMDVHQAFNFASTSDSQTSHQSSNPTTSSSNFNPISTSPDLPAPTPLTTLSSILLPPTSSSQQQAYTLSNSPHSGTITSLTPSSSPSSPPNPSFSSTPSATPSGPSPLLALPPLCHPHIHLDKPHLLTHSLTSHLSPSTGSFAEALSLTSKAKGLYTYSSLLERGMQLVADSVRHGVGSMRCFVEVDSTVGMMCVDVGLEIKKTWERIGVEVQVCAFAQDPIFTFLGSQSEEGEGNGEGEEQTVKGEGKGRKKKGEFVAEGNENLGWLKRALDKDGVDVLGTTPYVEGSPEAEKRNVEWAVREAVMRGMHLDFHLDYNLDGGKEARVWDVVEGMKRERWVERQDKADGKGKKTVCLGHCTRLTLFSSEEWEKLARKIKEHELPVYFVGLPTSDLFMQGRPDTENFSESTGSGAGDRGKDEESLRIAARNVAACSNRPRCTMHLPSMQALGLKTALGLNNIGNAFTPFGTADPLQLACWGVGIYQVGTKEGVRRLYGMVSWGAREAIGLDEGRDVEYSEEGENAVLRVGDRADFVLFGDMGGRDEGGLGTGKRRRWVRERRSVEEVVWDPGVERRLVLGGKFVSVD